MNVKNVYIYQFNESGLKSHAVIEVPGLGEVKVENALSDELRERIVAESIAALRLKLGQKLKEEA